MSVLTITIACGVCALIYGLWASQSILSANAGSEKMQEIAGAIQEGAAAYLNRQYTTITIVGIVVAIILFFTLGLNMFKFIVLGTLLYLFLQICLFIIIIF